MRGNRFSDVQTGHYVVLERIERPSRFLFKMHLDIDSDLPNFERHQFWREISRDVFYSQARTSDMEHPTLRMFHKWLGYNLFHRDDIRKVRVGDLQLLYAAINKTPTSPVTLLVSHWLSIPSLWGPVGCTSLITRRASSLHLLENSSLEFIDELRILMAMTHLGKLRC